MYVCPSQQMRDLGIVQRGVGILAEPARPFRSTARAAVRGSTTG